MTETKISGAIGFDGGGYEDASGRIHCSPSTSIHFPYEAGTRLPSFRPGAPHMRCLDEWSQKRSTTPLVHAAAL